MNFGVNLVNSFCRVVSQVEYPSLVDLRGLLLDLVAINWFGSTIVKI